MITIEREHHVCDMSVTWTAQVRLPLGRTLKFEWHGPVHIYHPETPDSYRRNTKYDDDV